MLFKTEDSLKRIPRILYLANFPWDAPLDKVIKAISSASMLSAVDPPERKRQKPPCLTNNGKPLNTGLSRARGIPRYKVVTEPPTLLS